MGNQNKIKGRIGILTGGGDAPGLNSAIRGFTLRALSDGYEVVGIRKGWSGLLDIIRDKNVDNSSNFETLSKSRVDKASRTGGTFLHTSRTKASKVPRASVPDHLQNKYNSEANDLTPEVLKNIEFLGLDYLVTIGGDDTLSYAVRLHEEGVKLIGIPKTIDNDVPGTDYSIGFSTCVTKTVQLINSLRTNAGSHERILVVEVFGRYAGFTAMLPTLAGAANRCVIPEYKFDIDHLTQLLTEDRAENPSKYSIVLVSEGATFDGSDMVFADMEKDMFGHAKLGGIGELVSTEIMKHSPRFNNGKKIETIYQKLSYLTRGGDPDINDSLISMAYGNLALDLIAGGIYGRLVSMKNGNFEHVPISAVTASKKLVNVEKDYNSERLRPNYRNFQMKPFYIMTDF